MRLLAPVMAIAEMFRGCIGPTLIIRCTGSEWPAVLDAELDDLATTRPNIRVVRLPLTHTGPVTAGVDQAAAEILRFFLTPDSGPHRAAVTR